MKSKDAYLKRKRDAQQHLITEAKTMVGKNIEVRSSIWASSEAISTTGCVDQDNSSGQIEMPNNRYLKKKSKTIGKRHRPPLPPPQRVMNTLYAITRTA